MNTLIDIEPLTLPRHPATYTDALLPVFVDMLQGTKRILDPFGGTGKIFEIEPLLQGAKVDAIEIEPEWAAYNPRTTIGNALSLPWGNNTFDAICTSPCLAHGQRVLRRDLRWVPVEEIREGDELIAFDEFGEVKANGQEGRRAWRVATVSRSIARLVDCVKVALSNGESVVCTPEHPWLAQRYKSGGNSLVGSSQWVQTKDLMSKSTYTRRVHGQWVEIAKKPTGWWVHKQLDTWDDDRSYDAGWLAGIMDGEGSLSFGVHGSPKLMIAQVEGVVNDLIAERLRHLGLPFSTLYRTGVPEHRQQVVNTYVAGGFPGILKALGSLRPERLISKLDKLDIASRAVQAGKVQVVAIEPVGQRYIQEIETSTGTYIGEGYLMHNCYGNRMADSHTARDNSRRNTYTHAMGRKLHSENAGAMQWGIRYRVFHVKAWTEARRVLQLGGFFVLNIKDHYRNGKRQYVTDFHRAALKNIGFLEVEHRRVECPGQRFGANGGLRMDYESVILFKLVNK